MMSMRPWSCLDGRNGHSKRKQMQLHRFYKSEMEEKQRGRD